MNSERITLVAQLILSILLFGAFGWALYLAWYASGEIQAERLRIIDTMVGSLGTMVMAVVTYWFARQRNAVAEKPT